MACSDYYGGHISSGSKVGFADLMFCLLSIFTGRNEVVAKVIFLHLFVILFTGGGSASVHAGIPPRADPPGPDPPRSDTPPDQTPPRSDTPRIRHPPREADSPPATHAPPHHHAHSPCHACPPVDRPNRCKNNRRKLRLWAVINIHFLQKSYVLLLFGGWRRMEMPHDIFVAVVFFSQPVAVWWVYGERSAPRDEPRQPEFTHTVHVLKRAARTLQNSGKRTR